VSAQLSGLTMPSAQKQTGGAIVTRHPLRVDVTAAVGCC
jgi:hypothetical protein